LDGRWHWSCTQWPAVHNPGLVPIDVWLNSSREGPEIIFSMLMGVRILLAELALMRRSDYHWGSTSTNYNVAETVS
jgi:hypothetical protein